MAKINYNLLSSVALFSDLFNNNREKDIYDIVGEYILAIVSFENKFHYTDNSLYDSLLNNFGFKIPKSVVRNVVQKRLKNKCDINAGQYHFLPDKLVFNDLSEKFSNSNNILNEITSQLSEYIFKVTKQEKLLDAKEKIDNEFQNFLLDDKYEGEYVSLISAFLLKIDKRLVQYLDGIRESVMLYKGITYTPNLNELGSWQRKITFYLNTEILFNASGLNGEVYRLIFEDFFKLVNEINDANNKQIITLKYFNETQKEIENFYGMAVLIKEGKARLDLQRAAMRYIINNSNSPSEIIIKKVEFFEKLKGMDILLEPMEYDVVKYPKYNLYSAEGIENINNESIKTIEHDNLLNYIEIYSKINMLRGGKVRNIDEVQHIFLTDNSTALFLAHNVNLKISPQDVPYAKDLGFYTNKFWFALKKGFSDTNHLPKSFDVITRSKLVLAAQVSNKVYSEFSKILEEIKNNKITEEQASLRYQSLKNIRTLPDEMNNSHIDESLAFLDDENYTLNLYDELSKKDIQIEDSQKEIEKYKLREKIDFQNKHNNQTNTDSYKYAKLIYSKNNENLYISFFYFVKSFIPEIITVVLTLIVIKLKFFNQLFNEFSFKFSLPFIYLILVAILVVLANYIKSYFIDKIKVNEGYKSFKLLYKNIKKRKLVIEEIRQQYLSENILK